MYILKICIHILHTICIHHSMTSISKTIKAFSKSASNFQRGDSIYFLDILIFNLPAFW